jgi:hypothetical protein
MSLSPVRLCVHLCVILCVCDDLVSYFLVIEPHLCRMYSSKALAMQDVDCEHWRTEPIVLPSVRYTTYSNACIRRPLRPARHTYILKKHTYIGHRIGLHHVLCSSFFARCTTIHTLVLLDCSVLTVCPICEACLGIRLSTTHSIPCLWCNRCLSSICGVPLFLCIFDHTYCVLTIGGMSAVRCLVSARLCTCN